MTTKAKARKVARKDTANPDPVLALIAEHKALERKYLCVHKIFLAARENAEKKHGVQHSHPKTAREREQFRERLSAACEETNGEYGQFCRTGRAERKAGMRLARTKPTTVAGAAALIAYTQRGIVANFNSDLSDWCTIALKTVASALTRIGAKAA